MDALLSPLNELESYRLLLSELRKRKRTALATGVIDSQKCHLAYAISKELQAPAFIITHSEVQAKEIFNDMKFFLGDAVKFYPAKDILFYSADVRSVNIQKQRLEALNSIINNEAAAIILSAEAILDVLAPRREFEQNILNLKTGRLIKQEELIERLVKMGYEHAELVEGAGQFAVRGAIIDIYSGIYDHALRLEFWDDEIDSIRFVDTLSQRSIERLESAKIFPMHEQMDGCEGRDSLLGYMPENTIIFFDEPQRIATHVENVLKELGESIQNRLSKGHKLPRQVDMVFSYGQILNYAAKFNNVLFTTLGHSIKDFTVNTEVSFSVKSAGTFKQRVDLLTGDLRYWCDNAYRILILAGAGIRGKHIAEEMQNQSLPARYVEDLNNTDLEAGVITVSGGSLAKGFEYQYIKMVVISGQELFGADKKRKRPKAKPGAKIESFTDLKIGDYVVHDNHGIGIYKGIEQIVVDNVYKDYLKIEYADGGNLYIHVTQMDVVQKYIGSDDIRLKLNKLGGNEWLKAKTRAKKAVKDLAEELTKLYAKRQAAKGFRYSLDTVWQKEFEAMTPFEETDDQLVAIEDVKNDMESEKVMDRLICGDVGYGKTEVAIRAAFKAVQDGKQVAFLVPTTILAQQHYNTFVQRMKDFPIMIELMSRFRSAKQNQESIDKLRNGRADIVIGTHKILSKNMEFRDLGLIIVDEEQRFGVTHKERLKQLKENVDVMTLTATPIPRTLHMSLTGIRDMSILEQPPQERQPIQTYVMEYDTELIRDAIKRELARDGQVYYLHNRVHNISDTASKLQQLVPEAVFSFAHGRMSEHELENVMMDFIEGEIDVLVCTTIIETGLDISNVNTIIIEDADNMGLSQLYQLRGRVGRSNRLAYAYLMYRKNKELHEIAEKRLQTIRDFTEFGSGFKIAMRDLEIRGAGNLLGGQQHGHIDAVGYDMYCKLLMESISEMRGGAIGEGFETNIDVNINAYIPDYYIKNEEQRLEIYKKISLILNEQDYNDIQEEIEDRFGNLPGYVQNILDIALLKAYAHRVGIISIQHKAKVILINFKPDANIDPQILTDLMDKSGRKLSFAVTMNPCLSYKINDETLMAALIAIRTIIKKMGQLEN